MKQFFSMSLKHRFCRCPGKSTKAQPKSMARSTPSSSITMLPRLKIAVDDVVRKQMPNSSKQLVGHQLHSRIGRSNLSLVDELAQIGTVVLDNHAAFAHQPSQHLPSPRCCMPHLRKTIYFTEELPSDILVGNFDDHRVLCWQVRQNKQWSASSYTRAKHP